jgi:hypothetical protein
MRWLQVDVSIPEKEEGRKKVVLRQLRSAVGGQLFRTEGENEEMVVEVGASVVRVSDGEAT